MSESSADVEVVAQITLRRETLRQQLAESTTDVRQWAADVKQLAISLPVTLDLSKARSDLEDFRRMAASVPVVIPVQLGGMGGMSGGFPGTAGMVAGPGGMASGAAVAAAESYFNRAEFGSYLSRSARNPNLSAFNAAIADAESKAMFPTNVTQVPLGGFTTEGARAAGGGGGGGMAGFRTFFLAHALIRGAEEMGAIHSAAGSAREALGDMYAGNATHQFRISAAEKAIEDVNRINQRGLNPLLNWLTGQEPGNTTADDIVPRAKSVIERESIAERSDKIREQRFGLESRVFGDVRHMEAEADQLSGGGGAASTLRKINNDLAEELRAIKEHTTALAALNDGTTESKTVAQNVAKTYSDRATAAAQVLAMQRQAAVTLEVNEKASDQHAASDSAVQSAWQRLAGNTLGATRIEIEHQRDVAFEELKRDRSLSVEQKVQRNQDIRSEYGVKIAVAEMAERAHTGELVDQTAELGIVSPFARERERIVRSARRAIDADASHRKAHEDFRDAALAELGFHHNLEIAGITGSAADIRMAGGHQIEPMFSRIGRHPSAGTLGEIIAGGRAGDGPSPLTAAALAHNRHIRELLDLNQGDPEKQNAIRDRAAAESHEMMDKLRNAAGEDARRAREGYGQEEQNMLRGSGGGVFGGGGGAGAFGGGGGLDIAAANQAFHKLANSQQVGVISF